MNAEMLQDRIPGVEWSPTRARVTEDLSFEQFEAILRQAFIIGDATRWWIGDLLIYGEARYGEEFPQALSSSRVTHESLVRYQKVAARIDPQRRNPNLSFSHHYEVSLLNPDIQTKLLQAAETNQWPVAELRQHVRDEKGVAGLMSAPPTPPATQEVLDAADVVGTAAGLTSVRESLEATYRHLQDPQAHPLLETVLTIPPALRALDEAQNTVTEATRVVDFQDALDRACRYYREALTEIIAVTHWDVPDIEKIQEVAGRGIRAADHELKAVPT